MGWTCPKCNSANITLGAHPCPVDIAAARAAADALVARAAAAAAAPKGGGPPPGPPPMLRPVTRDIAAERLKRELSTMGAADQLFNVGLQLKAGIPVDILAKWDEAIRSYNADSVGSTVGREWPKFRRTYTVGDLANLDLAGHQANVNAIWEDCAEFFPYDTHVANMIDPAPGNTPSSLSQPALRAFAQRGICFRCDTRTPESVTQFGFSPAYALDAYTPAETRGTIMTACCRDGTARRAAYWKGNRDIISETAICVSRSLRGCGKFPTPATMGTAHIYAFKLPTGLAGFDTERRQVTTGGRWLPGEKAFGGIDAACMIAHVEIRKNGHTGPSATAWESYSYTVLRNAWTFRGASAEDQAYLTAELAALTGGRDNTTVTVLRAEDFDTAN